MSWNVAACILCQNTEGPWVSTKKGLICDRCYSKLTKEEKQKYNRKKEEKTESKKD